ncbi:hypothetical protein [Bartonella tribocorum]|uniref:hypothetical protein n=1 Tax=Bartonella tribocorum TaxID=85701 RepID=UPI0015D54650|nr:hypothetical protein [Bartonella tribocorum]
MEIKIIQESRKNASYESLNIKAFIVLKAGKSIETLRTLYLSQSYPRDFKLSPS